MGKYDTLNDIYPPDGSNNKPDEKPKPAYPNTRLGLDSKPLPEYVAPGDDYDPGAKGLKKLGYENFDNVNEKPGHKPVYNLNLKENIAPGLNAKNPSGVLKNRSDIPEKEVEGDTSNREDLRRLGRCRDEKFAKGGQGEYVPGRRRFGYLPVLPDPVLGFFEGQIAEFFDSELQSRMSYGLRCERIRDIARSQIENPLSPDRRMSRGIEALLDAAVVFLDRMTPEKLREYQRAGCDVNESLFNSGIRFARDYAQQVRKGKFQDGVEYAAENAVRAIRALMSIAEYERFGSKQDAKENEKEMMLIGQRAMVLESPHVVCALSHGMRGMQR